jgi:PPK2 family polyphosphate:nucleotide phosphotransferase
MATIKLSNISTEAPSGADKLKLKKLTEKLDGEISELQNVLYAQRKYSLLVVLQGIDASGKDGAIKHVFGPLNPQGVQVAAFKVPTAEEAAHDFLWRIHAHTPARGMIQIFNRSHYEDVLVTRVHGWIDDKTAKQRMQNINDFERLLQQNNTVLLKFYLHISKKEQAKRLKERILDPHKRWKYSSSDMKESQKWHDYLYYYEEVFDKCSKDIPWTIVPADHNWYKEYLISQTVYDALKKLNMHYPRHITKN